MRDLLIRAIYVEMLGHDGSFAHFHSVVLTQHKSLLSKRIGYLTSTLFLDKDHEMLIMLVATLQKDLESHNYLEVLAALHTISRVANQSIMLAVMDKVITLLQHSSDFVKKKAVMVMIKFWKISPSSIENMDVLMKTALCDKVPSVMSSALNYFVEASREDPA